MGRRVQQLQQQQTTQKVSGYDLNRVQTNVAKVLGDVQASGLQFIPNEPKSSSAPGSPMQAWIGADGTLKICVAKNSWFKFSGAAF